MTTMIHFVRHGAVLNPRKIYYGRLRSFHLDPDRLLEVHRAAGRLQLYGISAIFSSPLERAMETAEIISEHCAGLPVQISEDLLEVYSPFDGESEDVLNKMEWDVYTGTDPKYEQPADVLKRARNFIQMLRREYRGKRVAAITHGDLIAFTMLWANRLPLTPKQKRPLYNSFLVNASVSSILFTTDEQDETPVFI